MRGRSSVAVHVVVLIDVDTLEILRVVVGIDAHVDPDLAQLVAPDLEMMCGAPRARPTGGGADAGELEALRSGRRQQLLRRLGVVGRELLHLVIGKRVRMLPPERAGVAAGLAVPDEVDERLHVGRPGQCLADSDIADAKVIDAEP